MPTAMSFCAIYTDDGAKICQSYRVANSEVYILQKTLHLAINNPCFQIDVAGWDV